MIGVFDSGVGGLQAVSVLRYRFPKEDIVYFADTAHLPYGNRDNDTLLRYASDALRFLCRFPIRGILAACGTVSTTVLPTLQRHCPIPLFGILEPTAQRVAALCEPKWRVGVIATEASVRSDAYRRELCRLVPSLTVKSVACPCFVPQIESDRPSRRVQLRLVQRYLAPFQAEEPQLLILGCTHFPLLSHLISEQLPRTVLLDAGKTAAQTFAQAEVSSAEQGRLSIYVSGDALAFQKRIRALYPTDFAFAVCKNIAAVPFAT